LFRPLNLTTIIVIFFSHDHRRLSLGLPKRRRLDGSDYFRNVQKVQ
jgi:hypothetical protein